MATKEWASNNRYAGSSDRSIIVNIINTVMRRKISSAYLMDDDSPRSIIIGTLFNELKYDIETIKGIFNNEKYAPTFLTDQEIKCLNQAQSRLTSADDWVKLDVPKTLLSEYRATFTDNFENQLTELATMPDLDIRVNSLKTNNESVSKGIAKYNPISTVYSPYAMRLKSKGIFYKYPNLENTLLYNKGHFEVQNEGSQISAILSGAKEKMQILDYCAGQGGKSVILSAIMHNSGQIYLHDINESRLKNVPNRMKRLGVKNYQIKMDLEAELRNGQLFDVVFVDAPCSGSGTWRRKPDLKWKFNEEKLLANVKDQFNILNSSKNYVKVGGNLVYVTCSVFDSENDKQIDTFLRNSPNFKLMPYQGHWLVKNNEIPKSAKSHNPETLLLSPMTNKTDGFFVAILKRFE
jgi:16S rRNA (cytosine967-C5)-methyltransferase